ncbi:hypothetical protein H696_01046 [Fonticula alba]|uniref:VWFA domain-containing protein n=1 Tax=Fonticula alba TaxID=691883 RepID=A0A058ZDT7_FONAL|nr:hypothetical protein H696_01046 [Fonticula alba]KCV71627.1 hypothetical protein H696_01046 [Fonticula alba]|eukprot:XP_009493205.1 hypothetical protein H696_01046 [Fonticula alba]
MAVGAPTVLTTFTRDVSRLLTSLHSARPSAGSSDGPGHKKASGSGSSGTQSTLPAGAASLASAIQVALLALRHRPLKNQSQRIIAFVGRPLDPKQDPALAGPTGTPEDGTESPLVAAFKSLGLRLKKNNVAIDIVSFGETACNNEALSMLVNSANNTSFPCNLLTVAPEENRLLAEALVQSPILMSGDYDNGPMYGAADDDVYDSELALALRLSLEEHVERERRAMENPDASDAGTADAQPPASAFDAMDDDFDDAMFDENELAQAIALSLAAAAESAQPDAAPEDDGSSDSSQSGAGPSDSMDVE